MWKRLGVGAYRLNFNSGPTADLKTVIGQLGHLFSLFRSWQDEVTDNVNSSVIGWAPYVFTPGLGVESAVGATITLAANGGTLAVPMAIPHPMRVARLYFYAQDAALARSAEWGLYSQLTNDVLSGESLTQLATAAVGTYSTGGSTVGGKVSDLTSTERIQPGVYWLVFRNTHATNTFGLGSVAAGSACLPNTYMTKTVATALGATLDITVSGWTKAQSLPVFALSGAALGSGSAW